MYDIYDTWLTPNARRSLYNPSMVLLPLSSIINQITAQFEVAKLSCYLKLPQQYLVAHCHPSSGIIWHLSSPWSRVTTKRHEEPTARTSYTNVLRVQYYGGKWSTRNITQSQPGYHDDTQFHDQSYMRSSWCSLKLYARLTTATEGGSKAITEMANHARSSNVVFLEGETYLNILNYSSSSKNN